MVAARYAGRVVAPEFPEGLDWIGCSRPLRLHDLRGRLVILDFWTFCCINCQHVLPQLRYLEELYAGRLTVIGVHSPKFTAEHDTAALRAAVERLSVEHVVVNDRDFAIWRLYTVRAWPTLVFIDPNGRIIGRHEGEFDLAAMRETIDAMMEEFGISSADSTAPRADATMAIGSHMRFPGKAIGTGDGYAISDTGNHRIVITSSDGRVQEVFGGPDAGLRDGEARQARFRHPQGLAVSRDGLWVADTGNYALRLIDPQGRVHTVAGDGAQGDIWNSPWDITYIDPMLYVAMAGNHRIVAYSPNTRIAKPYAGSTREGLRDGRGTSADLAQPSGICLAGNQLIVADSESSSIRAVDLRTQAVTTLIGEGLFEFGDRDGVGKEVRLQHPLGVTAYQGRVYICDAYNHRIKELIPETKTVRTIAGGGRAGLVDGYGTDALFSEPGGIATAGGRLLVTDTNNHALRLVDVDTHEVIRVPITGF